MKPTEQRSGLRGQGLAEVTHSAQCGACRGGEGTEDELDVAHGAPWELALFISLLQSGAGTQAGASPGAAPQPAVTSLGAVLGWAEAGAAPWAGTGCTGESQAAPQDRQGISRTSGKRGDRRESSERGATTGSVPARGRRSGAGAGGGGPLADPEVVGGTLAVVPVLRGQLGAVLVPSIVGLPLFPEAADSTREP